MIMQLGLDTKENFESIQVLRDRHDDVLVAQALCESCIGVVKQIASVCREKQALAFFKSSINGLDGHIRSAALASERMKNTIELVCETEDVECTDPANEPKLGYSINHQGQRESKSISEKLAKIADKSTKDNALITVITFLSAVFIPGSFVGTIYGMNFFVFDQDSKAIVIAHDFWIFIVTWYATRHPIRGLC